MKNKVLSMAARFVASVFCFILCSCHSQIVNKGPEKLVFGNYMVTLPVAGRGVTVQDFKAEILDAKKHGLDGFFLNCGSWTVEPHYRERTLKMYEAAKELDIDFKLAVSADFTSNHNKLSYDEFDDMVISTRDYPNQLRVDGKPVIMLYRGDSDVTKHARSRFIGDESIVIVANFLPPGRIEHPDAEQSRELFLKNQDLDGFYYFAASGTPETIVKTTKGMAPIWLSAGKIFISPLSPYYRGLGGNYRAFETRGFEGMAAEWEESINNGSQWAQIIMWNDWGEATYVCPFGSVTDTELWDGHWGEMLSHEAYLQASSYYIKWFKTGIRPTVDEDSLYYFYRLHPKTTLCQVFPGAINPRPRFPSKYMNKDDLARPDGADALQDNVYVTVFLTAPADLTVFIDSHETTLNLSAGPNNVSVPMALGTPRFVLKRGGMVIIDKTGEFSISPDNAWGNFNYFSGSAVAGTTH